VAGGSSRFLDRPATAALGEFVAAEYAAHTVYPPIEDLFAAYRLCPPSGPGC
jgi:uracil-DNA glycosylase